MPPGTSSFYNGNGAADIGTKKNELQIALCDPKLGTAVIVSMFCILNMSIHIVLFYDHFLPF
jgi:hypothetical protein